MLLTKFRIILKIYLLIKFRILTIHEKIPLPSSSQQAKTWEKFSTNKFCRDKLGLKDNCDDVSEELIWHSDK